MKVGEESLASGRTVRISAGRITLSSVPPRTHNSEFGASNVDWKGGVVNAAFVYGPYGEILDSVGVQEDEHLRRFNGKESDEVSSLSYYGYRYYDELSLSWTQADPLYVAAPDIAGANPREMTLYAFSLNNPIRYMDPDGLQAEGPATCDTNPSICGGDGGGVDLGGALRGLADTLFGGDWEEGRANAKEAYVLINSAMARANAVWYSNRRKRGTIVLPPNGLERWNHNASRSFVIRTNRSRLQVEVGTFAAFPGYGIPEIAARAIEDTHPDIATGIRLATVLVTFGMAVRGLYGHFFSSSLCFTEGTLVATANDHIAIENIKVGERVLSLGGTRDSTDVDATWRWVSLEMPNPDGSWDLISLELLRPFEWTAETGAKKGATIHILLEEMDLGGPATVLDVRPVPHLVDGPGEIVTGTVTHLNGYVLEIELEGSDEILEPTRHHPLYSVDRNSWVQAGELIPGERLLTPDGPVEILAISEKAGVHRVFNLEVDDAHSYLVGELDVWAHNTCPRAAAKAVSRGQGPRGITRIDRPSANNPYSQWEAHVGGRGSPALLMDGTWKHVSRGLAPPSLPKTTLNWLRSHGWEI